MKKISQGFIALSLVVIGTKTYARPQYAAAKGINDCTACHFSPAGGGPKTVFGKITGSHGFAPAPKSMKDMISGEVRAMALSTTKEVEKNSAGISIMAGNLTGAVDIVDNKEGTTHLVATYDFLGYSAQAQQAFLRWQSKKRKNFTPQHIVAGKFNIPFGLLTDEHRTYIRQQTYSSENLYELGAMISGTLSDSIHYDLALVQGFQQGNAFPGTGIQWGVVPNLRMMFATAHTYIGLSGLYYKNNVADSPVAAAAYIVSAPTAKLTVMFEVDYAKNMNDSSIIGNYLSKFVDSSLSSTYYNDLIKRESLGALLRFDYSINNKWAIFNKTDFLAPDQRYLKDFYINNGIGFKYFINSNMDIDARFEKTYIARDGIKETGVSVGKDRILVLGHAWF
jgi:archaellum component FlaG (FlaF/FlaG flagellin family)